MRLSKYEARFYFIEAIHHLLKEIVNILTANDNQSLHFHLIQFEIYEMIIIIG